MRPYLQICLSKKIISIASLIFCLILGSGIYPLVFPALLIIYFLKKEEHRTRSIVFEHGYLKLLMISGLFLSFYWLFYVPYNPSALQYFVRYNPNALNLPWGYFPVLFLLSIVILFWIGQIQEIYELIGFIYFFCLGALIFSVFTVGASIIVDGLPLYGKLIDVRYLLFGYKKYINTPGISNLLCLFPSVIIASLLLPPSMRPKWFLTLGIGGYLISLLAAIAIGQRSYFILTLIIQPLIVSSFLLLRGSWKPLLITLSTLIFYPGLWLSDYFINTSFIHRFKVESLLNDGRFKMLSYWIDNMSKDPFRRVEVGPNELMTTPWFHNFFADIHRISGFWALFSAVLLVTYIFTRVVFLIRLNRNFGLFLMAIAIPCLLIMNTSVVPEGERQPFLLLLAIGAITEVVIAKNKRKPKTGRNEFVPSKDVDNA